MAEEKKFSEYPKMVYLHPVDKTRTHKTKIVNNADEEAAAIAYGYRNDPHVPVAKVEEVAAAPAEHEEYEVNQIPPAE